MEQDADAVPPCRAATVRVADEPGDVPAFLAGGGEMGARMRAFDWAATDFGPVAQWPSSLRTAVSICLKCRFPILLLWGERFLHLYNDDYRAILGLKHPVLGQPGDLVWPEIWDVVGPMLRRVVATGEATASCNLLLPLTRDGSGQTEDSWFSFSYSPIVNEARHVAGIFCPVFETTETVRAQRRLEAEGGRLKALVQKAPAFMAVTEGADHVFALANERYCEIFGRGSRNLVGTPLKAVFPEAAGQAFFDAMDHALVRGEAVALQDARVELRGPDGVAEERFFDVVYQPIVRADGSTGGLFIQGIEVTSAMLAKRRDAFLLRLDDRTRVLSDPDEIARTMMRTLCEELLADRASYFEVDDAARTATVICDHAQGVVSLAGRTFAFDDYGARFATAIRRGHPLVLDHPEQARLTPLQAQRFVEIGIGAVVIFPLHKDGQLIALVEVYQGVPRRWRAFEVELVHQVVNRCWEAINRARVTRALREADRSKDEFIATLAHELRNPLAPILNGLAVLAQSELPTAAQRMVPMMDRQARHLVRLVDDLLDLSRVTHGVIELDRQVVDLRDAVSAAIEAVRDQVQAQSHELTVDLPGAVVAVQGDAVRLTQVFSNLIGNAAKYTPRGGRFRIAMSVEADRVATHVIDNGIGIAPEHRSRVFETFARVHAHHERQQSGLGIGLSLVRKLAHLHGGSVDVYSQGPQTGSTFTVRLPLSAAPMPVHAESVSCPRTVEAGRTRRVLIVDDNLDAAEALAALLRALGCDVRVAFTAADGLNAAATEPFDLALLDIGLPDFDGYELAARIRRTAAGRSTRLSH
jgi:signal transduction histidine kinase